MKTWIIKITSAALLFGFVFLLADSAIPRHYERDRDDRHHHRDRDHHNDNVHHDDDHHDNDNH